MAVVVPRQRLPGRRIDQPQLHERVRPSLPGPGGGAGVLVRVVVLGARGRDRGVGGRLGHAPPVQERQADCGPVGLRQRPGGGRPAAEDRPERRQVELVEVRPRAHPDRRDARRDRDAVSRHHAEDRQRRHVRPGEHEARPGQQAAVGHAPGVRVEHRHHGQHDVPLRQREEVGGEGDQRVQQRRAVAVDHALRVAGGAGRVAHGGRAVLVVDDEPAVERGVRRQELLVVQHAVGQRVVRAVVDHHDVPHGGQLLAKGPEHRQQRAVDEDDVVFGVVGDVDQLLGEQPDVEGVQHPAGARCGEVELEVRGGVPAEGRDAAVGGHAQGVERRREPADADGALGDRGRRLTAHRGRDHRLVPEQLLGSVQDVRKGQWPVLHEPAHR